MSVSVPTIKKLYGFSYNECAHPDCVQTLIEIDKNTSKAVNYGKIAHIHGRKPGAERFLQEVFDNKDILDGFDNVMLLCGRHHDQVDQPGAGATYTADILRTWKQDHILAKLATEIDREWVFGGQTINFDYEDERISLSYWFTKDKELKFNTEDQLVQTNAARDISLFFGQLGAMLSLLEQASGEPENPSVQTRNDGYMRMLKEQSEQLKKSWNQNSPDGGYDSALHRVYDNFNKCPDITLGELAEVGSEKRTMKTTLILGEITPDRITETIKGLKKKPS